jgi:hypothetical protein
MPDQRAENKVLLTAWVPKDFKEAVTDKRLQRGEKVEDFTQLVVKLLKECAKKHGVKVPEERQ